MNNFIKPIIICSILLLVFVLPSHAETVTRKHATSFAKEFFSKNGIKDGDVKLVYDGRRLTTDRLFAPFYVFNHNKGGFVIISAENKAFPILGFSLNISFDPAEIDENLMALLKTYARDIELIRYDSGNTDQAIKEWNYYRDYLLELSKQPVSESEEIIDRGEAEDIVWDILDSSDLNDLSSDIYSPSQWMEIINDEIAGNGNLVVGIVCDDSCFPLILSGQKGDFYRIYDESGKEFFMRIFATEVFSEGQIADLSIKRHEEEEEYLPESYFISELTMAESAMNLPDPSGLTLVRPYLRSIGGGRYEVVLPGKVAEVSVFNLSGALLKRNKYNDTTVASVSLEGWPYGFYFISAIDKDGNHYGFKAVR